ncbi:protein of unknown function (plasmid) [Citrobacter freundii]|nr:protein of unknown function [Citrobacter freundii]
MLNSVGHLLVKTYTRRNIHKLLPHFNCVEILENAVSTELEACHRIFQNF